MQYKFEAMVSGMYSDETKSGIGKTQKRKMMAF